MKVTLKRTGGFANIARTVELDTEEMPAGEALKLQMLCDAADVFNARATPPASAGRGADRFAYVLTVEDGAKRRVIHATDGAMSPEVQALIEYLSAAALARMRQSGGGSGRASVGDDRKEH